MPIANPTLSATLAADHRARALRDAAQHRAAVDAGLGRRPVMRRLLDRTARIREPEAAAAPRGLGAPLCAVGTAAVRTGC